MAAARSAVANRTCGTSASILAAGVNLPDALKVNANLAVANPACARTADANLFVPIFSSAIYWRA